MLSSSLSYIITRSFPECILLILASYILLDLNIDLSEIIKRSIVFVIIVLGIRILPISFGIHTILIMFALGIIIYKFKYQNIIETIFTISKILICLVISEGLYMAIATILLNIPVETITNNTSIESALKSLPSLGIFIILVLLIKVIDKKIKK